MSDKEFIIALDQGTTSSRALLVNNKGQITHMKQQEFPQIYPQPGWVEHDPEVLFKSQEKVLHELLEASGVPLQNIAGIGLTNQRETTVLWDKETGKPVYNAIVWQDKRTADLCEQLQSKRMESYIRRKTGLLIDSYFSATKVQWILREVPEARELAQKERLLMGTVDTWLLWKFTRGKVHATDYTNASRTMLFDINTYQWDQVLLDELDIPYSVLPEVKESSAHFGDYVYKSHTIPITGIAGDQQAALFGQACFEEGSAKNTYGTGCFLLMNTGEIPHTSKNGLLTTIAWGLDGKIIYALEGSIFNAGSAIQWLRDELGLISSASESEDIAMGLSAPNPVYVVPAFSGLGAPHWDMYARGAIYGLTRDTGRAQLVQATLQSLAYQTRDMIRAMQKDSGLTLNHLKVDGGASANSYLMQFQSDILGTDVIRPRSVESTALGAAYLAGCKQGLWDQEELTKIKRIDKVFSPNMDDTLRKNLYKGWKKAVKRSSGWLKE